MKDFKKRQGFGNRDGGRPQFGGGFRGGQKRGGDRETEMFQAICASCGKSCEVPFRPNGKKPVYCKECFAGGEQSSRGNNFNTDRDSSRRNTYKPEFKNERRPADNIGTSELMRELEMVNSKLEKLISILSDRNQKDSVKEEISEKTTKAKTAPKNVVKKAKAKK
jgi:CxxC-x17-CxxC domain-containing protein